MALSQSQLREVLLYVAAFGTSHIRRTFDDCNDEGAAMKTSPKHGTVLNRMFRLPDSVTDKIIISMYGVGGLTMEQVYNHYHVDSFSGSSEKLMNISKYFQDLMRNPLDCLIIQIGDNDVAPYCKRAKGLLAQGEELDPNKVAIDIANDIILLARKMKLDFGASRVVLLPLMPRYYVVKGYLTQGEVLEYNTIAEQVNLQLKNKCTGDEGLKYFFGGTVFHFKGDSYVDRAKFFFDGVHLSDSQDDSTSKKSRKRKHEEQKKPPCYTWVADNIKKCIINCYNDLVRK